MVVLGHVPQVTGDETVGRPVRVVSLCFRGRSLTDVMKIVDLEGAKGADLIVLPETWRGQSEHTQETLEGTTLNRLGNLARRHNTYIVSPIDRRDGDIRLNSAVLIDRQGRVVGVYD